MNTAHRNIGDDRVPRPWLLRLVVVLLCLTTLPQPALAAQPATPAAGACLVATEPNDQPVDAIPLPEGAACAEATVPGSAQDLYRWQAPEGTPRWTLALSGIPGQVVRLEVYTVALDDAGTVTSATKLVERTGGAGEGVSLDGLLWPPGEYYVGVATSGPGSYRLDITTPGDPLPPAATSASGTFAVSGAGPGSLTWTLDDVASGSHYTLQLQAPVASSLSLQLTGANSQTLALLPVGPDGVAALPDTGVPPGDYTLAVSGGDVDTPWIVSAEATGERAAGQEDEPNESGAAAMPLAFDGDTIAISGRLALRGPDGQGDRDVYRLTIDDAHAGRFTDIRLLGQGTVERRLCLLDPAETELRCVSGTGGTALNDLVLTAGEYLVAVSGVPVPDMPYLLRVEVTGEAVSGFEQEPNDRPELASPLAPVGDGWTGAGRLGPDDVDHVAVTIAGDPQLWRIDLTGDFGVTVDLLDATGSSIMKSDAGPNGPVINDAYLVPGTQVLRISGTGDYTVTLTPLGLPDPQQEREPNGAVDRSQPIRLAETRTGRLATAGDTDVYRFSLQGETTVRIAVDPPDDGQVALELDWQGVRVTTVEAAAPGEPAVYTGTLQAGDYVVWLMPRVPGEGMYEVRIDPLDPFAPPDGGTPAAAPLAATLDLGATPVAAYWPEAQRIDGAVTLKHAGDGEIEVALDAKTGNPAWTVTLDAETVTVGAGETTTVPVSVLVAPDARAGEPVYVAIRAAAPEGQISAMALVTPDGQAQPLASEAWWPLPDSLLGGIDVAATGAGATPVAADEVAATEQVPLYDGLPTAGTGWRTDIGALPAALTVDLAGDEPVPIAGFTIDPAGIEPWPGAWPSDVELQLSTDGQAFETVWRGTLAPVAGERSIALDTPAEARFARLRILTAQDPAATAVSLGGWKVIAQPGWEPDGDRNLADPALGGHVVDMQPPLDDPNASTGLLAPDAYAQTVRTDPGASVSFVLGFQHDRAARLAALAWIDPAASNPDARLDRVTVEISTGSPLGPWESLGEWELARDATGTATLAFDEPPWARFVRITGIAPGEGDAEIDVELPDVLRAIEMPAGDGYRSIAGEWGGARPAASFERLAPAARPEPGEDAGNDADAAADLPLQETRAGVVAIGEDEDWYRVDLPADATDLAATIGGVPVIGVTVEVFDDAGEPVEAEKKQVSATALRVTATGAPGASYLLRVTQPPTSVVIAFDTSFSIGPLETTVYQGLNRFATDVQSEREFVDVLPFGETSTLLPGFSDDPYLIQGAVAAYPRTATSSDAEGAILTANDALKGRPGTRAIVLITDGESSPTADQMARLWPELAATGPRVFTVGIAGSDQAARGQDVMQDWATVGGGYVYVRDQGAMDVAFARIATELRRPALYTIAAEGSAPTPVPTPTPEPTPSPLPTPTPEPTPTPLPTPDGTLLVTAPEAAPGQPVPASGAQGQVAIVLDTSGSMLQPLDGGTRADVARAALIDLITTTIPPGTTVSLRTFGDTPDSCETRLVVPAGPLDPAAMSATIASVPVVNLVRTPIGAALEAALTDLAAGDGPKIVVLVTDGEETCDGDPAAAIQALVDSGIDVRVNIVGFAIDDPALAATFQDWARLGNGQYIDAGNAAELNAAVAAAVQPTFDVLDPDGGVVARGQVGAPVSLPPGHYRVLLHTSPVVSLAVTVEPGQQVTLPLPP